MHATAWRAFQTAHRRSRYPECRIIAHVQPSLSREFHRSAVVYQIPDDQAGTAANGSKSDSDVMGDDKTIESSGSASRTRRRRDYSSVIRRAKQSQQPPQLPPVRIPEWFFKKNVKCAAELAGVDERISLYRLGSHVTTNPSVGSFDNKRDVGLVDETEKILAERLQTKDVLVGLESTKDLPSLLNIVSKSNSIPSDGDGGGGGDGGNMSDMMYHVHGEVFTEVLASIRADLVLPHPKLNKDVFRPDTLLLSPGSDRVDYLNAIVDKVAWTLGSDIIRLDLEDLITILSDYLDENIAWTKSPTALIGYDSERRATNSGNFDQEQGYPQEVDENDRLGPEPVLGNGQKLSEIAFAFIQSPNILFETQGLPKRKPAYNFPPETGNSRTVTAQPSPTDSWLEYRLGHAVEKLVQAASAKRLRGMLSTLDTTDKLDFAQPVIGGLIIHINEYQRLSEHPVGSKILTKIREAVNTRWHGGGKIVIVGSAAEEAADSGWTSQRDLVKAISTRAVQDVRRTIFIPPPVGERADDILDALGRRTQDINIRHLEEMVRKLINQDSEPSVDVNLRKDLSLSFEQKASMERSVWSTSRVRRAATTMIGMSELPRIFDGPALRRALSILSASTRVKVAWATSQDVKNESASNEAIEMASKIGNSKIAAEDRIKKLKRHCSSHEKKLLGGIIDPANINVTFDDIQAPPETIEALKTLITLSIARPDSFSYGVLAADKIPGVLLYGPPGVGKTLLAKAVAKESGSTVLEVSASEINDMYVGEGEKNIKAVFSLAKKLSPCVVFLDEADALFGARGDSHRRRSHRELINQWLRELDGMENQAAFIMVATNRPFDIDEAILRRLPRRLLVDLPVEKDREAILRIHLKDEILDDSVSVSNIAKDTPFYSGSDLKNLSVAAALACVREENELAAKHAEPEAYIFPPKRILRKEHFDKAIEEISASISEDMSTLAAIRKFDEKYGDRKGRRKRSARMGFGGTTEPEKDSEAGRVRKMAAVA